ncbi:hypothetical protein AQZ52_05850 [Novosphingobium fuchskuhlense]|uniref:DUF418 domain-containing protein n=1 Tax=Novosphingobium fuchskuhlense TaxID=1117702 RepID=A0A117UXN3_9SPHN|nr:DUF418 domain-containing protein [Novosphingobium fuchskuhlense]KUR72748.1 hypothetical protein AQZ52_05850 [Novosphingobium fuchskuhlense]
MPERIGTLDFVRGLAVLGILAINVTGFWGPLLATFSPAIPCPDPAGALWFVAAYVLFEGKMRGLFTLLFGASMMLFADAAERRGANPDLLQARRLLWLLAFGYAHYALLWWGDILFPYAVCGMLAFCFRRLAPEPLAASALLLFLASHVLAIPGDIAFIGSESRVLAGHGTPAEAAEHGAMMGRIAASVAADARVLHAPFLEAVRLRLTTAPLLPLENLGATFFETFPLMLLGMALVRLGLFTGGWEARTLRRIAVIGIGAGGAMSAGLIGWAAAQGFPAGAMFAVMGSLAAIPHLLMTFGYLAVLLLLWPRLKEGAAGRCLAAAGRCAFTNYLGTTLVMSALFAGWGLGLGGVLPRGALPLVVLGGWALMLAWPEWWLARFGQGPLEALWRRLTWWGPAPHHLRPPAADAA